MKHSYSIAGSLALVGLAVAVLINHPTAMQVCAICAACIAFARFIARAMD